MTQLPDLDNTAFVIGRMVNDELKVLYITGCTREDIKKAVNISDVGKAVDPPIVDKIADDIFSAIESNGLVNAREVFPMFDTDIVFTKAQISPAVTN